MEVSSQGRGFTSLVFGMGQLSDEGVIQKNCRADQHDRISDSAHVSYGQGILHFTTSSTFSVPGRISEP